MGQKLEGSQLELYRRTDEILHYIWDPIGIAGDTGARDEYDGYLAKVFTLLNEGKKADVITTYLLEIATTRMGLRETESSRIRAAQAAEKVVKWKNYLSSQIPSS